MNVHETYLVVVFSFPPPTYIIMLVRIDVCIIMYLLMYVYIHHNYTHIWLLLQGQLSKGNKDRS